MSWLEKLLPAKIQQTDPTERRQVPEGFQRAEFLQTKGAVDFICDRRELRDTVASSLAMLQRLPADAVM